MLVQAAYMLTQPRPRVPHQEPGGFDGDITDGEMIANFFIFVAIVVVVVLLVKSVKKKEE